MSETTVRVGNRFISLRVKLLVGFTLLFSVVFAIAFFWFFRFATDLAIGRVKEDLEATLHAAEEGIDEADLIGLYENGEANADEFSDDPRYNLQMDWLETVHAIEPRAWPYTYVRGAEPCEVIFIGDLYARYDTSKAATFKESYISSSECEGTLWTSLSQPVFKNEDFTPYVDKWGTWVSGYTPIVNDAGDKVGGIGVDFQATYVNEVQQAIFDSVFIAFAITYAVLFILVYLFSGAFSRPIVALTGVAERIGEGDYDQDLANITRNRFPDEIDTLSNVFGIMVDKVYQREQTLRKQVEDLRIMVDHGKRDEQVSEIVESDFFQSLQEKARNMRDRTRRSSD